MTTNGDTSKPVVIDTFDQGYVKKSKVKKGGINNDAIRNKADEQLQSLFKDDGSKSPLIVKKK